MPRRPCQVIVDCLAGRQQPVRLRLTYQAAQDPRYTMAALIATEGFIARDAERVAAAVRAVVKVQRALKKDPGRATEVGRRRFPPDAGEIIATLVERDLPFYDPMISEGAVATMNRFAQAIGLLAGPVPYEHVVATRFRDLWRL